MGISLIAHDHPVEIPESFVVAVVGGGGEMVVVHDGEVTSLTGPSRPAILYLGNGAPDIGQARVPRWRPPATQPTQEESIYSQLKTCRQKTTGFIDKSSE